MTVPSPWRARLIEGLVIIASILIAFMIDAWWEGRQDDRELEALVALLVADIEADVAELHGRAARSDSIVMALDALLAAARNDVEAPGASELTRLIGRVTSTSQTEPSLFAYDVVRGTDAWNEVPPKVKVALSEYMRGPYAVDRQRDADAVRSLVDIAARYEGTAHLFFGGEAASASIIEFLADPAAQSWIMIRRATVGSELRWQRSWVERLPQVAEGLTAQP